MKIRNSKGQFLIGYQESKEEKIKRIKGMVESWKTRPDLIRDIKHPKIYNCWRSFMFTLKGKKIGHSKEWGDYRIFYNDVISSYEEGRVLTRIDKTMPFSKDNFMWTDNGVAQNLRDNCILLEYNGSKKTLKEWSFIYGISLAGIRIRYHRYKNYSSEEILFGKKKPPKKKYLNSSDLPYQKLRDKASKMCSMYKNKDNKRRYIYNLSIGWVIDNILLKPCTYCGDTKFIGCDRIDNSKGHTIDNVVPCCIVCNVARSDNFNFEEMKVLGKTIADIRSKRIIEIKNDDV